MLPEIEDATDGALRVARRNMIKSHVQAKKARDRLDLIENGDRTQEGVWHHVVSGVATADEAVSLIEKELDARDAEYRDFKDVASSV